MRSLLPAAGRKQQPAFSSLPDALPEGVVRVQIDVLPVDEKRCISWANPYGLTETLQERGR